ncbi:MAG: AbrB/MazE/SpoVT family DNA-binding domain-containing protein [Actinobacteria bacterium]|nr:AbrB/MazE/SpoVT family DNA-binding domain-containing protein [Actinomycetota bacterium]
MHATGIRRKVDDLGRIVIPAGIRKSLDINEGDPLDVSVDGDRVVLMKPVDRCVFCGGTEELGAFRAKMVCRPCVAALGVLDGGAAPADAPDIPAPGPTATIGPQGLDRRVSTPDERAAGVRDERRAPYDPASSTAW